jgi:hypothetical protein
MLDSFARRATLPLTISCLWLALASPCFGTPMQDQKPATQHKKSTTGNGKQSAKDSAGAKHVEKSSGADKLSNERMSTRGLHKGKSDQTDKSKQGEPSTTKSGSKK